MKSDLMKVYLVLGITVCGFYSVAAARGWKAPDLGIFKAMDSMSSSSGGSGYYGGGRSYGGSWGGGK